MATDSRLLTGLPSLPNEQLTSQLYNEFGIVYRTIRNLTDGVGQLTGIDSPDAAAWADTPMSSTILTGNATRLYPIASELIAPGQLVNLFNNAGVLGARLASSNSATTMAHGIAVTGAGIGSRIEMQYLRAFTSSIGGMVIGQVYYTGTAPGTVQNLPPVAAGTIQQPIGVAVASNQLLLDISLSFKQN